MNAPDQAAFSVSAGSASTSTPSSLGDREVGAEEARRLLGPARARRFVDLEPEDVAHRLEGSGIVGAIVHDGDEAALEALEHAGELGDVAPSLSNHSLG